jgi:tripartite-type tricarboxylate transporter receptor subunit TctC
MKKTMKKVVALLTAFGMVASMAACGSAGTGSSSGTSGDASGTEDTALPEVSVGDGESSLKGQNVRVVIGSTSTSGDSYMIADLVTRYLSKEMGFNGKVDAIGNAAALDEMQTAKGDGKTVMMFHDMTFLSVLFGSVDESYALENMTVGPRIGQNPGACFGAAAENNWNNLSDVVTYLQDNPDATVSCNIESGATSHLAFVAWYLYVRDTYGEEVSSRIKAIVGGTTAEKLQRLWDRNADIIYGDTSAFEQYTEDGVDAQLKMTMFGSCGEVNGVDIDSMAEDGVTFQGEPFEFAKDFAMYFPKDMDATVLAEYEAAMKKVTEDPDFIADMEKLYYNTLSADEVGVEASKEYIYDKREMCQELIDAAPSLDELTQ